MDNKKHLVFESVKALIGENATIGELTVAKIADKAGIGKGTIYEYFTSKEEIFQETFSFYCGEILESMGKCCEKERFNDCFSMLIEVMIKTAIENKNMFRAAFVNLSETDKTYKNQATQTKEIYNQLIALLRRVCLIAENDGLLKRTPDYGEMVFAFFSVLTFVGIISCSDMNCTMGDKELSFEELCEFCKDKFLRLIR